MLSALPFFSCRCQMMFCAQWGFGLRTLSSDRRLLRCDVWASKEIPRIPATQETGAEELQVQGQPEQ